MTHSGTQVVPQSGVLPNGNNTYGKRGKSDFAKSILTQFQRVGLMAKTYAKNIFAISINGCFSAKILLAKFPHSTNTNRGLLSRPDRMFQVENADQKQR